MNAQFIIYGLVDPRNGAVRYIGKSSTGRRRPNLHRKPSVLARDKTHKANWIRSLQREGLTYTIEVLEIVPSCELLNEAERYWIAKARGGGWPLTNHTVGGEGVIATRRTRSVVASRRRYAHSAETKAKIGAAHRGKVVSPETRSKVSVANGKSIRELGTGRIYASARAAADALNLEYSGIVKVAAGTGRLKSHHGYRFEYLP